MHFGGRINAPSLTFKLRLVLAIVLAWGLIVTDQRLGNVTSEVRNNITSWVITPIRAVARFPTAAWTTTSDYFKTRQELILAKRDLEEELLRERVRQRLLVQIEKENDALKKVVEVRQQRSPDSVVAEVINTASLPFINRIVLSKGSQDGVQNGSGVFSDEGVIGRLSRVDGTTSQALLLTDRRFWVATRSERTNELVLLQGAGAGKLRMRLVPAEVDLKPGDVLVTAGGAQPYPAGLPVAIVESSWQQEGLPFQDGYALPLASIRQDSVLLVHNSKHPVQEEIQLLVEPSGAVPADFSPEVLP